MAGFDRSRISLGRRTQQQTDTRDDMGGARRQSYMDYRSCNLKFFKFAEPGKYQDINILPWRISSKNHPSVVSGDAEIGDYDYVLDVWVHPRLGPENVDVVCPKKTYGKYCPACEEADRLWANEDTKEDAKALFAKRRCLYVVEELNDKWIAIQENPKIFDVSQNCFSKDLQAFATSCLRGKGVVPFADPDKGKIVSFIVSEESMGKGKKFKKATNFAFNERVEEITDETLEKCPSLDSMLIVKSADEIKAILFGAPDSGEESRDESDGGSSRFRDNNPEADEDTGRRGPTRFDDTPRGRPARDVDDTPRRRGSEDENGEYERPRRRPAPEDDIPQNTRRRVAEDAGQVDEPPARNTRAASSERSRREPEQEDTPVDNYREARNNSRRGTAADEPETNVAEPAENPNAMPFDEPEEPKETRKPAPRETKKPAMECPQNYVFGEDCERMPLCSRCPDTIYAKCMAASKKG